MYWQASILLLKTARSQESKVNHLRLCSHIEDFVFKVLWTWKYLCAYVSLLLHAFLVVVHFSSWKKMCAWSSPGNNGCKSDGGGAPLACFIQYTHLLVKNKKKLSWSVIWMMFFYIFLSWNNNRWRDFLCCWSCWFRCSARSAYKRHKK